MSDDDIIIPIKIDAEQANDELKKLGDAGEAAASRVAESLRRVQNIQAKNVGISLEEFQRRGESFGRGGPAHIGGQTFGDELPDDKTSDGRGADTRPPNLERKVLGETDKEIGESAEGIRLFREALHAFHPALGEAGIGVGELTSFVRAATGGIISLATAIGTTLLVAMEKAGDEAEDAANRLGTFSSKRGEQGGVASGRGELEGLGEVARERNFSTASLAAPYEQLLRINQGQSGEQAKPNELRETLNNILKGFEAERVPATKAIETVNSLFKSVQEKGFLDRGETDKAAEVAPRTIAALVQQLEKNGKPDQQVFTGREVLNAGRSVGPQVSRDLEDSAIQSESIATAWQHVKAAGNRLAEATSGGHVVATTLEVFSKFLDQLANGAAGFGRDIERIKSGAKAFGQDAKDVATHFERTAATNETNPGQNPYVTSRELYDRTHNADQPTIPRIDPLNRTRPDAPLPDRSTHEPVILQRPLAPPPGTVAAPEGGLLSPELEKFKRSLAEVDTSKLKDGLDGLPPPILNVQQTLEKFADQAGGKVLGSKANAEQARIDLAYEPAETASKLTKSFLNVESAGQRLTQAFIGAADAAKRLEESQLAPQEAQHHLESAQTSRDNALSKFLKGRGVDTSALDQQNQNEGELNDLNSSEDALKKAQIEKKYAYLEPQKAELGAQQAETNIRSAELEQNDATLKYSKDQAGAPVSHELQLIKYAQATFDFQQLQGKNDDKKIALLQDILDKIGKGAGKYNESTGRVENNNGEPIPASRSSGSQSEPSAPGSTESPTSSGNGPSYRTDEQGGGRVDSTLADVLHFNQEQAKRRGESGDLAVPPTTQTQPVPTTQTQPVPNTGAYTHSPQDTGTGPHEPQDTGTGPYEPQNTGAGRYEPQNTGAGPYEPQNTGAGRYEPQDTGTGPYAPQNTGAGRYEPQDTGTGTHEPQNTGTGRYEPQDTGTGTHEPQNTGTGPYAPQNTGTRPYEPQDTGGPYEPQNTGTGPYEPQSTGTGPYAPQSTGTGPYAPQSTGAGPRTENEQQPQSFQTADLTSKVQELLITITSAVTKKEDLTPAPLTGPVDGLGIRGEAPSSDDQSSTKVADAGDSLASAISSVVNKVDDIQVPDQVGDTVHAAEGGHINFPGRPTHIDTIPAILAHDEFVQPAKATQHYGVPFMESIRNLTLPKFNAGGLASRFTNGMTARVPMLGFAGGGHVQVSNAPEREMEHWGTVDMRTNHGEFKVATERDTMRHVAAAANKARKLSTGPKPNWYGGGSAR